MPAGVGWSGGHPGPSLLGQLHSFSLQRKDCISPKASLLPMTSVSAKQKNAQKPTQINHLTHEQTFLLIPGYVLVVMDVLFCQPHLNKLESPEQKTIKGNDLPRSRL